MAFPEQVKDILFDRSGGRCECRRSTHSHGQRCPTTIWRHRGVYYHHVYSNGSDAPSNGEALCPRCHKGTRSYGRSKS